MGAAVGRALRPRKATGLCARRRAGIVGGRKDAVIAAVSEEYLALQKSLGRADDVTPNSGPEIMSVQG